MRSSGARFAAAMAAGHQNRDSRGVISRQGPGASGARGRTSIAERTSIPPASRLTPTAGTLRETSVGGANCVLSCGVEGVLNQPEQSKSDDVETPAAGFGMCIICGGTDTSRWFAAVEHPPRRGQAADYASIGEDLPELQQSTLPDFFSTALRLRQHPTCRGQTSHATRLVTSRAVRALGPIATMATTSNMFLYSLTIQPPTHITQAVVGQFAGTKEQHILTASGSRLVLLRPDPTQGKVLTVLSHDIFGIIRAMAAFRLAGSSKGMCSCPWHAPPRSIVESPSDLERHHLQSASATYHALQLCRCGVAAYGDSMLT